MFPFYMMLADFVKKSKVISFDFPMMKNIVALSSSSLPIKLICCLKAGFSNSICCSKLLQLVYSALKSIHGPKNYQLYNYYFCSFQYCQHVFPLCFLLVHQKAFAINQ